MALFCANLLTTAEEFGASWRMTRPTAAWKESKRPLLLNVGSPSIPVFV